MTSFLFLLAWSDASTRDAITVARLWTWSRLIAWAGKVASVDAGEVSSPR